MGDVNRIEEHSGLGAVEVLVVGVGDNELNGGILPALDQVVTSQEAAIVDAVLFEKTPDGRVDHMEVERGASDDGVARLAELMEGEARRLLSADDVEAFAASLESGQMALALVLEHTWAESLLQAVSDAGLVISDLRVPEGVVRELEEALAGGNASRAGRPGLLDTMAQTATEPDPAGATPRDLVNDRIDADQAAREQQTANQEVYEAQAQMADLETRLSDDEPLPATPPQSSDDEDLEAKLGQLSELHDSGALTDEEFAAARAKLLA